MTTIEYAQLFNGIRALAGAGCYIDLQNVPRTAPSLKWLVEHFAPYFDQFAFYHRLRSRGERFNCRHWTRAAVMAASLCHLETSADDDGNDLVFLESPVILHGPVNGIAAGPHRTCLVQCDDGQPYLYEPQTNQVRLAQGAVDAGTVRFLGIRD